MSRIPLKAVLRELYRRGISFERRNHSALTTVYGWDYDREKKAIEKDILENKKYMQEIEWYIRLAEKRDWNELDDYHRGQIFHRLKQFFEPIFGNYGERSGNYSGKWPEAKRAWDSIFKPKMTKEARIQALEKVGKYFVAEIQACKKDLADLGKMK